jgi:predicted AlkP superfamily phosphohydrolase/phosphomutase
VNSKLLIIGLDGGTFDLIRPWVEEGKLPNISKIMNEGVHGTLKSIRYPHSALAWSSIVTGLNPGAHGIYYFTEKVPNAYGVRYINAGSRKGVTLWRWLSSHGKAVGALNVPMSYPPEEVNGFIVGGVDSPSVASEYTYPPNLARELKDNLGEYVIDLRLRGTLPSLSGNAVQVVLDDLNQQIENRYQAARYLINKHPWDLFMLVFTATDRVQHGFWKYMDETHSDYSHDEAREFGNAIMEIYEHIDQKIGDLMGLVGDDTSIMIISDHGFGPGTNNAFYPNKWLSHKGLLKWKEGAFSKSGISSASVFARMLNVIKRSLVKRLSRREKEWILKFLPGLRAKVQSSLVFSRIDWKHTRAFSDEMTHSIWINLKGREPEGTVEPGDDYEELREYIIKEMSQLKDPKNGHPIVDRVYRREELYHGPYVHKAPDLIIDWRDAAYRVRQSHKTSDVSSADFISCVGTDQWASGCHRLDGIFMMRGLNVRKGAKVEPASILDVMPTALYSLGVPIPSGIDGRVIEGAFEEAYQTETPVEFEDASDGSGPEEPQDVIYSPEEAGEIEERLRGLGYIE